MSFDIVQRKNCPISGRQLSNGLVQGDAIHDRHRIRVLGTFHYLNWRFAVLGRLFHAHTALAKVHENLVDREPVKPGGEGRFASKATDFSKELYEDFLSKVFSFRNGASHPEAQRVNATIMALVKIFKSGHVTLGRLLRQLIVCRLRCLGIGCRHVIRRFRASWKKSYNFRRIVQHIYHASAVSRECTVAHEARVGLR